MNTDPNDQAFPGFNNSPGRGSEKVVVFPDGTMGFETYHTGMTKREAFAKAAMQGMHAGGRIYSDQIPELAVKEADRLIAALNKTEVKPS